MGKASKNHPVYQIDQYNKYQNLNILKYLINTGMHI